jgi:hypothetical protein
VVHWPMASQQAVLGFNVDKGTVRLNPHLIPVHANHQYNYGVNHAGPYRLEIVMRDGKVEQVPILR